MSIGIDNIRGIRDDLPGADQPSKEEFREWAFGRRILNVIGGGHDFMDDWAIETDQALALFAELISHPGVPDVKKRMLYNGLIGRLRLAIEGDVYALRQEDDQWCTKCLSKEHHPVIAEYCNTYKEVVQNPEKFKPGNLDFEQWELGKLREGGKWFGDWPSETLKN